MPIVLGGKRAKAGRGGKPPSVHAILLGALGALLRLYGIATIAVIFDLPGLVADSLRLLAEDVAGKGGLEALAGLAAAIGRPLIELGPLGLLLVASGILAWLFGGKLLDRGWKAITARWSRRARLALLFFNALGTALWIIGLVALAYPFVSAYIRGALGGVNGYLTALVSTAKSVHIALIAFSISALTPALAGAIHATQSWGRRGRMAAILLSLGGLIYGVNAIIVYAAWRHFASTVLERMPHIHGLNLASVVTPQLAALILRGLAGIISMFTIYLRVAMVAYLMWLVGFIAAWLDYWRASRGTKGRLRGPV